MRKLPSWLGEADDWVRTANLVALVLLSLHALGGMREAFPIAVLLLGFTTAALAMQFTRFIARERVTKNRLFVWGLTLMVVGAGATVFIELSKEAMRIELGAVPQFNEAVLQFLREAFLVGSVGIGGNLLASAVTHIERVRPVCASANLPLRGHARFAHGARQKLHR